MATMRHPAFVRPSTCGAEADCIDRAALGGFEAPEGAHVPLHATKIVHLHLMVLRPRKQARPLGVQCYGCHQLPVTCAHQQRIN